MLRVAAAVLAAAAAAVAAITPAARAGSGPYWCAMTTSAQDELVVTGDAPGNGAGVIYADEPGGYQAPLDSTSISGAFTVTTAITVAQYLAEVPGGSALGFDVIKVTGGVRRYSDVVASCDLA